MQILGAHTLGIPRMWHNKTPLIPWNPTSLEDTRTWFPKWIRWEQWRCRWRQQRLLLSLASSLLASFAGKNYTNLRRARARTPRKSHGCYTSVLLLRASPLPFIAIRGLTEENPWINSARFTNAFMAAFMDAVKRCNNVDSPNSNIPREHWIKSRTSRVLFLKLFRVQSVWRIQLNHFSGILLEKEVFSDSGSDESSK